MAYFFWTTLYAVYIMHIVYTLQPKYLDLRQQRNRGTWKRWVRQTLCSDMNTNVDAAWQHDMRPSVHLPRVSGDDGKLGHHTSRDYATYVQFC